MLTKRNAVAVEVPRVMKDEFYARLSIDDRIVLDARNKVAEATRMIQIYQASKGLVKGLQKFQRVAHVDHLDEVTEDIRRAVEDIPTALQRLLNL